MLPIQGGRGDVATETQRETQAGGPVVPSTSSETTDITTPTGTVDGWVSVAEDACDAAGLDPARGFHQLGVVKAWMQLGATRGLILDVIRDTMDGWAKGRPITSLRFFDGAIRREIGVARPAKPVHDSSEEAGRQKWRVDVEEWRVGGCAGPMPKLEVYIKEFSGRAA